MNLNNLQIKVALSEKGLRQYDLARLLGIAESTCSKMLREELPQDKQKEIINLIKGKQNY